jgi:hypothetical protein
MLASPGAEPLEVSLQVWPPRWTFTKLPFGCSIEAMRGQVKGQVFCAHAGIIEAGYGGLQIRGGIARCADCGQSQHDCDRDQT